MNLGGDENELVFHEQWHFNLGQLPTRPRGE